MSTLVPQFQEAIGVLFTPSSKPEHIQQANRFLMEISEDKQCFGVCVEIISNQNSSIAVKHFSANILYTKVINEMSSYIYDSRQSCKSIGTKTMGTIGRSRETLADQFSQ